MKINNIGLNSRISDKAAFFAIMIAGAFIAWFTIHMGEKIINGVPNSEIFNVDKRVQDEIKKTSEQASLKSNKK